MFKKIIIPILISLIYTFTIFADIPKYMNYQGMLSDETGAPESGDYSIQFSFYQTETGGEAFWAETQTVQITQGLFNVVLGSVTSFEESKVEIMPDSVFLEIQVGSDAPMTPRKRFATVPYAFNANNAEQLGGRSANKYMRTLNDVNPDGGDVELVAGANVTITPNPNSHQIQISATGGTGGDDLGDHTADQNIVLGDHWLSGDGGDEGVRVFSTGAVEIKKALQCKAGIISTGKGISSEKGIVSLEDVLAYNNVIANVDIIAENRVEAKGSMVSRGKLMSEGHAGIGGYTSPTYALKVYGDTYTSGIYNSSDIKFKKNIAAIDNPVAKLMQLKGVSYDWKRDEFPDKEFSEKHQHGLIAQDVEKVFPEMVMTDENGDKAIAYYQLIPVMLEALKQQEQRINSLEKKIEQLGN